MTDQAGTVQGYTCEVCGYTKAGVVWRSHPCLPPMLEMVAEVAADSRSAWFFQMLERDATETARHILRQGNPLVDYRKR